MLQAFFHRNNEVDAMSKGQRGNKEVKKPKQDNSGAKSGVPLAMPSGLTPIAPARAELPRKKP
ncbi:hypothetical protein [Paucibacter sp. DJ2R-2]|uniref:hypothetical protein n=1 Tax=Paucibacter sp. DJ2R-2 TaxID=2893558 RepID=UPI0021E4A035|nr:hypothetical protein [Paucibacter sp. DJ2R-2]MCV2421067.1 hypothetical protein [Paucibacter sp. DJ4R-1]MCV2439045.1 hypothetical protein [Paucibacter sp. DJ2R-2]